MNKGKASARKIKRANILLLANKGETDSAIAKLLETPSAIEFHIETFGVEVLEARTCCGQTE